MEQKISDHTVRNILICSAGVVAVVSVFLWALLPVFKPNLDQALHTLLIKDEFPVIVKFRKERALDKIIYEIVGGNSEIVAARALEIIKDESMPFDFLYGMSVEFALRLASEDPNWADFTSLPPTPSRPVTDVPRGLSCYRFFQALLYRDDNTTDSLGELCLHSIMYGVIEQEDLNRIEDEAKRLGADRRITDYFDRVKEGGFVKVVDDIEPLFQKEKGLKENQ